jgi:hypothetical protein
MRVNARFDGEYERQVEFLTEATGMGVSDVLKASVAHYYKVMSAATQPRLANMNRFIGRQGSGRSDVSSRTKDEFAAGVTAKSRRHK